MDFKLVERYCSTRFQVKDRSDPSIYVPMVPNKAQRRFFALCEEARQKKRLQRWISVKSRRVGLSRAVEAIGTCMLWAYPGLEGRVTAHLDDTGEDMISCALKMASGLPSPLDPNKPACKFNPTEKPTRVVIPQVGGASILTRGTAKTPGKGRGRGFSFGHFSEVAHYPPQAPFTAMLPTMAKDLERSFVMLESTANGKIGMGEAFYNYWEQAAWPGKRSDSLFMRFFVPYTEDPYASADPRLAKDAPIDDEEKILLKAGVSRAQIAWRRITIATEYRGIIEDFNQENPISPEDAFRSSGSPAFGPDERSIVKASVKEPFMRGEFEESRSGDVVFRRNSEGRWLIWSPPRANHEYYIGADAARGHDVMRPDAPPGDFSDICVLDGTSGEQAAHFMERINPRDLAKQLDLAGRFYWTPQIGENHFALMNIEVTGNLGLEAQRTLRDDYRYPIFRFARWRGKDDRMHKRPGTNIGWETNSRTRDMMFAAMRDAIRTGAFIVFDETLAEQICDCDMNESCWGDTIARGHDDASMAAMVCYMARQQNPPRHMVEPEVDRHAELSRGHVDELPIAVTPDIVQGLEENWQELIDMGAVRGRRRNGYSTTVDLDSLWPERSSLSGL